MKLLAGRETTLGDGLTIRRLLPQRELRRVGPWIFLDHFGPLELAADDPGMRVGPHPHIGLQTVTWLLEGEVLHRDSLGYQQLIRPGQLNLMTAGRGIAHSEETPQPHGSRLHGVQLWLALPPLDAEGDPDFEHHAGLPIIRSPGLEFTLIMGRHAGEQSPARGRSPLVAGEIRLVDEGAVTVPLSPKFEYALMLVEGETAVMGEPIARGQIADLGKGRDSLKLESRGPATLMLVGGSPWGEDLVLWWNFVGRTADDIRRARADWEAGGDRFGPVHGYDGPRLEAPALSGRLRAD